MNKQGALNIGGILLIFIGVIVALAILPQIAQEQSTMTSLQTASNVSLDISTTRIDGNGDINESIVLNTSRQTEWNVNNCDLTNFVLRNQSGDNLTLTTDYLVNLTAGTLTLKNVTDLSDSDSNVTAVFYDYCPYGYIGNSGGRGVTRLITIFAALGLLGFVVFYFMRDKKW